MNVPKNIRVKHIQVEPESGTDTYRALLAAVLLAAQEDAIVKIVFNGYAYVADPRSFVEGVGLTMAKSSA